MRVNFRDGFCERTVSERRFVFSTPTDQLATSAGEKMIRPYGGFHDARRYWERRYCRTSHYFYRPFKFGTRKLIKDYDVSRFVDLARKILKKYRPIKYELRSKKKFIPTPAVKIRIDFVHFAILLIKHAAYIHRPILLFTLLRFTLRI